MGAVSGRRWWHRVPPRALLGGVRSRLRGRDLALIAAGLTFYAGIAVVPLLLLSVSLTAAFSSPEEVHALGGRLASLFPAGAGAPSAVAELFDAGVGLDGWGVLLALLPMSLYGEGVRRALLRFSRREEAFTAWRGRLAALPLLLITPVTLYPLLLAADVMAGLAEQGGAAAMIGRIAVGFYSVLAGLTIPLAWVFRVVGVEKVGWPALVVGALFTAACLSGFLQGFVLFLALPLRLGAPFGGLDVVGGTVAIGLWLFALHVVLVVGWLATQTLDELLAGSRPEAISRAAG
jgi:membrane protein